MDAELTRIKNALAINEVVRALPGEFDDNYEVLVAGNRRMLRISPVGAHVAELEFEDFGRFVNHGLVVSYLNLS